MSTPTHSQHLKHPKLKMGESAYLHRYLRYRIGAPVGRTTVPHIRKATPERVVELNAYGDELFAAIQAA